MPISQEARGPRTGVSTSVVSVVRVPCWLVLELDCPSLYTKKKPRHRHTMPMSVVTRKLPMLAPAMNSENNDFRKNENARFVPLSISLASTAVPQLAMDNPKHLRLWDCAVCSDDVQEREIAPLPLDEIKTPNSLISGLPGFTQLPGASFGSSLRLCAYLNGLLLFISFNWRVENHIFRASLKTSSNLPRCADSSILEHASGSMRTPGASGIATPASFDVCDL